MKKTLAFVAALLVSTPVFAGKFDYVVKIDQACSGTIVSSEKTGDEVKTQILTAKHCIKGKSGDLNIETTKNGHLISTLNVMYDVDRKSITSDLALVTLRDTENVYPTVTIADELKVDFADPVYVVGYPLGMVKTFTSGEFNGYQELDNEAFIRASSPITYGSSGGALFQRTENGFEQIGVTHAKINISEFMNFFVPLDEIHKFLRYKPTKMAIELPPLPIFGGM